MLKEKANIIKNKVNEDDVFEEFEDIINSENKESHFCGTKTEDYEKGKIKYAKISKDSIYNLIVGIDVDIMMPIKCINIINMAELLETSKYQVKKYVNILKKEDIIALTMEDVSTDDELHPPYWGYALTDKGKNTEYYKQKEYEENELIKKCFDS